MTEERGAKIQDSVAENVAGGDISTGNVIHHHHYSSNSGPPAVANPTQPVYQQPAQQFHPQSQYAIQLSSPVPLLDLNAPGSEAVLYAAWLFLGLFGGHRILLGDWVMGIVYACTCGLFLVGWIGDFAKLPEMIENARQAQLLVNQ